jgi:hypothetical protein
MCHSVEVRRVLLEIVLLVRSITWSPIWDGGPAAQAVDDVDPVQVRQPQIEDDQVRRAVDGRAQGRGAVGGDVHLVVAGGQVDAQRAQDLRLVIDHEDAGHPSPPCWK